MTTEILNKISKDLDFLKKKVNLIEHEISIIRDIEPEVREKYIKRLKKEILLPLNQ